MSADVHLPGPELEPELEPESEDELDADEEDQLMGEMAWASPELIELRIEHRGGNVELLSGILQFFMHKPMDSGYDTGPMGITDEFRTALSTLAMALCEVLEDTVREP